MRLRALALLLLVMAPTARADTIRVKTSRDVFLVEINEAGIIVRAEGARLVSSGGASTQKLVSVAGWMVKLMP